MAKNKLDQAVKDLIEAFKELESRIEDEHGGDEEAYASALAENFEAAIESAVEEHDVPTSTFAGLLSIMSDCLENIDPSAFEDTEEEEEEDEYELEDEDFEEEDEDDED